MITLKPQQAEAVPFVRSELAKGGEMFYDAPTGHGKMLVLLEAVRHLPRVAFISRRGELRDQFRHQATAMDVDNVTIVEPRTGFVGNFEVVIADETMKDVKLNHPCVVRCHQ